MVEWAIDDAGGTGPRRETLVDEVRRGSVRRASASPPLAVRLLRMVVHDNRKLFGTAAVRLDALIVHGGGGDGEGRERFYAPGTFRFDRVADGDDLPIGEPGLLLFYGRPRYFLDVFLAVSRDREGSDTLQSLLGSLANSEDAVAAHGKLLAMATGAPDPVILEAGLQAALPFGNLAVLALRRATSGTIGLYRASWLRGSDGWGIGRHPDEGLFRANDLSFGFEIIAEPG